MTDQSARKGARIVANSKESTMGVGVPERAEKASETE